MAEERVDKWLWAMRVFKTRTIATEACKKGRVSIGGVAVKPSRCIKEGDVIDVKKAADHLFFPCAESYRQPSRC